MKLQLFTGMYYPMNRMKARCQNRNGYTFSGCHVPMPAKHARPICEGVKDASIAAFIEQIPEVGKAAVATIVAATEPWEGSFIKTIVKPIRDDVFHYDYGKEMADVLRKLYLVEPTFEGKLEVADKYAQTRLFFADDFEVNVLGDIIKHQGVTIEEALQELSKLQMAIIKACDVITTTYLLFHKQNLFE